MWVISSATVLIPMEQVVHIFYSGPADPFVIIAVEKSRRATLKTRMQTLSRREEDALLKSTKAKALRECDDVVKRFAECATGRTISIVWACRDDHRAVQQCMQQYTNAERMEELRREFIKQRDATFTTPSAGTSGSLDH